MALDQIQVGATTHEIVPEIAPLFSTSTAYAVGDCVIKDAVLYRFKVAHAAGAWNASQVDAITVGGELNALKEQYISSLVTDTAQGQIATFPDGADLVPVKHLTVDVEPVQSGSGDPSPSNIRPLTGWSQAKVTRAGKNLLAVTDETINNSADTAGLTVTANDDGSFTVSGTPTVSYRSITKEVDVMLRPGGYILSIGQAITHNIYVNFKYEDNTTANCIIRAGSTYAGITLSKQVKSYTLLVSEMTTGTAINETFYAQLEFGLNATAFTPYTGHHTYTIDLDGTRYGGTLDVGSGVLTVDRAIVDLGTLVYAYNSSDNNFYSQEISNVKVVSGYGVGICETYFINNVSGAYMSDGGFKIQGGRIYIKDTRYTNASDMKNALDGVKLVYELADPVTVQLTPTEVTTLLGVNNVWANCGDVGIEYRADTKKYIEKILNT